MAFSSTALAQADYPTRPVTIMTPFSVGSGPDIVVRLVAEKLGKEWGQRAIVENRPGGSGFVAIEQARRAANDSYTLLQLDSEHIGALPHLYKKRGYQPFELFDPVAPLFQTPFMVRVSSNSSLKSFKDLVEAVKKEPNKIAYGSWGIGSPGHLGAMGVAMFAQTPMQHVPYKEMAQLFAAVSNQEVDWSTDRILKEAQTKSEVYAKQIDKAGVTLD